MPANLFYIDSMEIFRRIDENIASRGPVASTSEVPVVSLLAERATDEGPKMCVETWQTDNAALDEFFAKIASETEIDWKDLNRTPQSNKRKISLEADVDKERKDRCVETWRNNDDPSDEFVAKIASEAEVCSQVWNKRTTESKNKSLIKTSTTVSAKVKRYA